MTPTEVKEIRLQLGMTQEQLAIKLGCSHSTLNRWENGKATPSKAYVKHMQRLRKKK